MESVSLGQISNQAGMVDPIFNEQRFEMRRSYLVVLTVALPVSLEEKLMAGMPAVVNIKNY